MLASLPGGHEVHGMPPALYCPLSHCAHTELDVAPTTVEPDPAAQAVHTVRPVDTLYEPAAHAVHKDAPVDVV